MNVAELAEEVGLDSAAVLRMCRDRGIRASWEESELSDDVVDQLRQALAIPDPDAANVPHAPNPAVIAAAPAPASGPAVAPSPADRAEPPPMPEFGSIDPRFASLASSEDAEESARPREHQKLLTPEVETGFKAMVVCVVFSVAYFLVHLLPDWDSARWWLLGAVLFGVAAIAALVTIVVDVQGYLEVVRFPRARRGKAQAAAYTGIACVLLLAISCLAIYDYTAVNVPDAYDRLTHTVRRQQNKTRADINRIQGTIPLDIITLNAIDTGKMKVGDCYDLLGASAQSSKVTCDKLHGYEVVGFATLTGTGDYPSDPALKLQSAALCTPSFTAYVGVAPADSGYKISGKVPLEEQWKAGDRRVACIAVSPGRSTGSVRGTKH